MTETLLDERTEEKVETSDDKPESAHIVHRPDDAEGGGPSETNHAYVMRAMVEGFPVEALCGWVFTPSRGTGNLPVCQECKDIWDNMPDDGEGWVHE